MTKPSKKPAGKKLAKVIKQPRTKQVKKDCSDVYVYAKAKDECFPSFAKLLSVDPFTCCRLSKFAFKLGVAKKLEWKVSVGPSVF